MAFRSSTGTANINGSTAGDIELPADATDTITSLRWSPVADHLAAASWDGKVRIYDVAGDGKARGVAQLTADVPVFSCDFAKDGAMVVAGGGDNKIRVLEAASGQTMTFDAHKAPIRAVRFVDIPSAAAPVIASGSWDSTVSYWDVRQTAAPLATLGCGDRVYAMDSAGPLLVVATAGRKIHLVDLHANPAALLRSQDASLKHQTRAVAVSADGKHWSMGGIEGRCATCAVDDKPKPGRKPYNFSFKCHRDDPDRQKVVNVWAVNDLSYHPVYAGTLATVGADGSFSFWDLFGHTRLKQFKSVGGSITSAAFNRDGRLFAYAVGYDWSMGYAHNAPQYPRKLMLHSVAEEEVNKASRK